MAGVELIKDVVARWGSNSDDDYDDYEHECNSECDHDCDCNECRWCSCCDESYNECSCQHPYGDWCDEEE